MTWDKGKSYKPGDKGFDEIAKEVTHISKIKKESTARNTITAARVSTTVHARNETRDKLR